MREICTSGAMRGRARFLARPSYSTESLLEIVRPTHASTPLRVEACECARERLECLVGFTLSRRFVDRLQLRRRKTRVQFGAEEFAEQPFDSRPFRRIKSEKPFGALAITFVVIVMSLDELCAYGRLSRLRLASF